MTEQYGYNAMEHCGDCAAHVDDCRCCEPVLRTKLSGGYTSDDGREVPPHALYMYDCQCGERGHAGLCWYASEERAYRSYARRVNALVGLHSSEDRG